MKHSNKKIPLQVQCIAEFLGTGLIIFFGSSYLAALKLTHIHGSPWEISCIIGLSTTLAMYVLAYLYQEHI